MSATTGSGGAPFRPTRRIVFQGLGALGVAAALAGCGGGDGGSEAQAPASGTELASTSEVPVGGGIVLSDEQIVITQPTEGTFVAFSAICTHQSAPLARVEDGQIECDLHGSRFSAETGEPTQGPASSPLAAVEIAVDTDAGTITAA